MIAKDFIRDLLAPMRDTGFVAGLALVLVFKFWMISQLPSPMFHPDSHTFLRTAEIFWEEGRISIHPKRAWLYPILLTVLCPLPGSLGPRILVVQHLLALVVPLVFVASLRLAGLRWKWWAFPSVLALGLNAPLLFYSHDVMAELPYVAAFWLFVFSLVRLSAAGVSGDAKLLVPVFWTAALTLSVRPDGKLAVLVAFLAAASRWRACAGFLGDRRGLVSVALPAVACVGLWVGTHVTQQGWLFYSSVFPLTRLETPLHAEYKKEMAEAVVAEASDLEGYPSRQSEVMGRLSRKSAPSFGPAWDKLKSKGQSEELHAICKDLAIEAAIGDPVGVAKMSCRKIRKVMSEGRGLADNFNPSEILYDYDKQFEDHPLYARYLFGSEQMWEKARSSLGSAAVPTPLMRGFVIVEKATSPVWWSWAGLLAAAGWSVASFRCRPLAWVLLLAVAKIAITYTIARGIIRYLLPLEPLIWGGLILLLASWKTRDGEEGSSAP